MTGPDGPTATAGKYHRLYRWTAIARPLDPAYATNRAVLMLLPLAAVAGAVYALASGAGGAVILALTAAAVAFGAWALARELAPDDNPAAFVAMAAAVATLAVWPSPSLALLFTALLLVRIVNRTTGLTAHMGDSALVLLLAVWTAWSVHSPLVAAVAAIAFALDAVLAAPARRQWVFAGLAGAASVWLVLRTGIAARDLAGAVPLIVAAIVVVFLWRIVVTRKVVADCDVTGAPIAVERVKAGMLIALLAAGQALVLGNAGIAVAAPIWATLAAVGLSHWVPRPA